MRDRVIAQSEICLIKDGWLHDFPEELRQFGFKLKKSGLPQQYGRFTICRYAKESLS
jgi:hypothetical protein